MNSHVFGKVEVGFCGDWRCGGLYLDFDLEKWVWYTPDSPWHIHEGDYGLMEEQDA